MLYSKKLPIILLFVSAFLSSVKLFSAPTAEQVAKQGRSFAQSSFNVLYKIVASCEDKGENKASKFIKDNKDFTDSIERAFIDCVSKYNDFYRSDANFIKILSDDLVSSSCEQIQALVDTADDVIKNTLTSILDQNNRKLPILLKDLSLKSIDVLSHDFLFRTGRFILKAGVILLPVALVAGGATVLCYGYNLSNGIHQQCIGVNKQCFDKADVFITEISVKCLETSAKCLETAGRTWSYFSGWGKWLMGTGFTAAIGEFTIFKAIKGLWTKAKN